MNVNAFVDRGYCKLFVDEGSVAYKDPSEPGYNVMLWRALWSAIEAGDIPDGCTVSGTNGKPFKAFYVRGMPAPLVAMLADHDIDLSVERAPGTVALSATCPF